MPHRDILSARLEFQKKKKKKQETENNPKLLIERANKLLRNLITTTRVLLGWVIVSMFDYQQKLMGNVSFSIILK